MKRLVKVLIVPASVVAVLTVSAVVWALWSASGTGSAGTISNSLGVPGKPTAVATLGSGTVPVSWAGITSPSGNAADVTYYVVRSGGVPACQTSALTCNDVNVPGGTYTYTVQAKFKTWNSQVSLSSDSVTVVPDNTPPNVPAPSVAAAVKFGTNPIFVTSEQLTLSSAATDPGASATGVADVKYYFCAGASGSCTSSNGTLIDTSSTATGGYPVTWSSPSPDGPYRIVAVAKDNANNSATSPATLISVDTTPPSVSTPIVNG